MNQQCRCTHPMHTPTVVVGGRYVVGENPTYTNGHGQPKPCQFLFEGDAVTVVEEFPDGDVKAHLVTSQDGKGVSGYVNRRHLSPAPEPAAPPAVDDDLLAQVRAALTAAGIELIHTDRDLPDAVRDLARQRDEARATKDMHKERQQELETALTAAERERDEAFRQKTEWQATAGRIAAERDTLKVKVEVLQIEGDEARAERDSARGLFRAVDGELERLRAAQQTGDLEERLWRVLRESAPHPFPDNLVDAVKQLCDQARAAQQLPDVGPVTRDGSTLSVDGSRYDLCDVPYGPELGADDFRTMAAQHLAVAAFLDAEADNTSSNDEVDTVARVLLEHGVTDDEGHGTVAEVAIAVRDALRARGGQEADPAVEFVRRCTPCQVNNHDECHLILDGVSGDCCCPGGPRG